MRISKDNTTSSLGIPAGPAPTHCEFPLSIPQQGSQADRNLELEPAERIPWLDPFDLIRRDVCADDSPLINVSQPW